MIVSQNELDDIHGQWLYTFQYPIGPVSVIKRAQIRPDGGGSYHLDMAWGNKRQMKLSHKDEARSK